MDSKIGIIRFLSPKTNFSYSTSNGCFYKSSLMSRIKWTQHFWCLHFNESKPGKKSDTSRISWYPNVSVGYFVHLHVSFQNNYTCQKWCNVSKRAKFAKRFKLSRSAVRKPGKVFRGIKIEAKVSKCVAFSSFAVSYVSKYALQFYALQRLTNVNSFLLFLDLCMLHL